MPAKTMKVTGWHLLTMYMLGVISGLALFQIFSVATRLWL